MPASLRPIAGLIPRLGRGLAIGLASQAAADEALRGIWRQGWFRSYQGNPASAARLGFTEAGWTNICTLSQFRCLAGQTYFGKQQIFTNANVGACYNQCSQAVAGNVYPTTTGIGANQVGIVYQVRTHGAFGNRMDSIETWNRPAGAPNPAVIPAVPAWPQIWTQPVVPEWAPWADPFSLPIGQPVPEPVPPPYRAIPHRQPNPHRSPDEQPQRGPRPARLPRRVGQPVLPGVVVPNPGPSSRPGPTFTHRVPETGPSTTRVRWPRYLPRFRPKGKKNRNRKEKKGALVVGGVPGAVINALTEGLDFTNALWKALPDEYRRRGGSQWGRMQDLWAGFDHIDGDQAMWNLLENQVEDWVYGQAPGVPNGWAGGFGFQAGPWDTFAGEAYHEWQTRVNESSGLNSREGDPFGYGADNARGQRRPNPFRRPLG